MAVETAKETEQTQAKSKLTELMLEDLIIYALGVNIGAKAYRIHLDVIRFAHKLERAGESVGNIEAYRGFNTFNKLLEGLRTSKYPCVHEVERRKEWLLTDRGRAFFEQFIRPSYKQYLDSNFLNGTSGYRNGK